jgi:hypothetical protein
MKQEAGKTQGTLVLKIPELHLDIAAVLGVSAAISAFRRRAG